LAADPKVGACADIVVGIASNATAVARVSNFMFILSVLYRITVYGGAKMTTNPLIRFCLTLNYAFNRTYLHFYLVM
jgi:hypothetical protein